MKWFEGGIPAAIQTARQNKSVFIVFISGEDDSSSKMESELHQENVTQLCEENKCVAVKLTAESNDCKFFSQIYPVVLIPSTFFIGDTGVPLEVIGEVKTSEDYFEKVNAAVEAQRKKCSSNPPSQPEQSQPPPIQEEMGATSASPVEGASNYDSGGDITSSMEVTDDPQPDLSDKVERARQLVEEKRIEKARKEFEENKRKEFERRNVGQGVQKLRQTQKEMDLLEAKKELRKDREDDKLARKRVKEEIARDRAEKAARFQTEKDTRTKAADEAKKQKLMEQQEELAAEQARRSEFARIQFRLPDGASVTNTFAATDTFEIVYNFITERVGSSVSLSTTFPRRTFTSSDHSSTLQELNLAPSAALMVIPGGRSTSGVTGSGSALSLTNIIFAPFTFLWSILTSLFGLGGSSAPSTSSTSGASATQESATGGDRKPDSAHQRGSAASRQEGSIHRFRNAQDDEKDDDRSTWNGNSTQQM